MIKKLLKFNFSIYFLFNTTSCMSNKQRVSLSLENIVLVSLSDSSSLFAAISFEILAFKWTDKASDLLSFLIS